MAAPLFISVDMVMGMPLVLLAVAASFLRGCCRRRRRRWCPCRRDHEAEPESEPHDEVPPRPAPRPAPLQPQAAPVTPPQVAPVPPPQAAPVPQPTPAPQAAPVPPPQPPPAPPPPPQAAPVPQWRLSRARRAGECARLKSLGSIPRVPKTTPLGPDGAKTFFVIIRGREGVGHRFSNTIRGLAPFLWPDIRGHVLGEDGGLHSDAIFHGFHSREEAEAYWGAATASSPLQWLPMRRF